MPTLILAARYTRPFATVTIRFLDDDSAEFTTLGDVTDEEIEALAAAGGGDVAGWTGEILP